MSDVGNKPKRRLQFSLRTLLLLMLLVGGPLALNINQARKQEAVVRWVRQHGGHVRYSYESESLPGSRPKLPAPSWLIELLGMDFFDHVVSVTVRTRNLDDLTPLGDLTSLRHLEIRNASVSNLEPLSRIADLRSLILDNTDVVDLSPLSEMKLLQRLNVDHTDVADLTPLAGSTELIAFYGQRSQISDLSPLSSNIEMRSVNVSSTAVTDVSALTEMKKLEKLDVRNTAVADLSPLVGKKRLRFLDLFDTPATDLSPLSEAKQLTIEYGGIALNGLASVDGLPNLNFVLYKHPSEEVPDALQSHMQQVKVVPIFDPPNIRKSR